ncbi:MAG: hypothetical protein UU74_C0033G0003 [Candidatus Woesebacteria bacterium GW2011_GWA1_41_7]|uniref:Uncharacterized protein n=1 Tax=Candidatus Woesebacteria bacterium GW2011_GWA1_41_7 TaxID=1618556 RepID=A0A0G0Z3Y2_9BACT|nr:MAG: hypothetical protein UU74_C0033G0003 [Candidatus Woesebacteria bacterium GW2011_GWA1_41_7]
MHWTFYRWDEIFALALTLALPTESDIVGVFASDRLLDQPPTFLEETYE